jgi:hypothetical protein
MKVAVIVGLEVFRLRPEAFVHVMQMITKVIGNVGRDAFVENLADLKANLITSAGHCAASITHPFSALYEQIDVLHNNILLRFLFDPEVHVVGHTFEEALRVGLKTVIKSHKIDRPTNPPWLASTRWRSFLSGSV